MVVKFHFMYTLTWQVNSKVLTGDIADQASWIKKVQSCNH